MVSKVEPTVIRPPTARVFQLPAIGPLQEVSNRSARARIGLPWRA